MIKKNNKRLFLEHIKYEFLHGVPNQDILFEIRSIVPNIDAITAALCDGMKSQYSNTAEGEESIVTYTEKEISLPSNCFFKHFSIRLKFKKSEPNKYGGGTIPSQCFVSENGKLVISPTMALRITTIDEFYFQEVLSGLIGHELTHTYGYYQYYVKNGETQKPNQDKYFAYLGDTNKTNNLVANINYLLSKKELSAFLAQIRQEVIANNPQEIIDSESAMEKIKKTDSYGKYLSLEEKISVIDSCSDAEVQKDIILATNKLCGKQFKTYNQVLKYYNTRWYKWSKIYMIKAAKIIYDVFEKYGGTMVF